MKKFLLLCLLCSGLAHASPPMEDEPLPFDTRMPPRALQPVDDEPERVSARASEERPAARECRTVVRKVRGKRVRKQVCSKPQARQSEVRRGRHRAGKPAAQVTRKASARKPKAGKNRKRR